MPNIKKKTIIPIKLLLERKLIGLLISKSLFFWLRVLSNTEQVVYGEGNMEEEKK